MKILLVVILAGILILFGACGESKETLYEYTLPTISTKEPTSEATPDTCLQELQEITSHFTPALENKVLQVLEVCDDRELSLEVRFLIASGDIESLLSGNYGHSRRNPQ
jgi:hypothetical protein